MPSSSDKQELIDIIAASGAFRHNAEGNSPAYVAAVLRGGKYLGKPVEITGNFLELPQQTIMKELTDVEVGHEVTKLGNVEVLRLIGDVVGSNYVIKKGKKYTAMNKRSPHETTYTKVVRVRSGELEEESNHVKMKSVESSRDFFIDKEVEFPF